MKPPSGFTISKIGKRQIYAFPQIHIYLKVASSIQPYITCTNLQIPSGQHAMCMHVELKRLACGEMEFSVQRTE